MRCSATDHKEHPRASGFRNRSAMRWHRQRRIPLLSEQVFADAQGLQIVRVRSRAIVVRLPPWLPDLDENLVERNDGQPPLLEVLDLDRAVRGLRAIGLAVGDIREDGWEGLAELEIPDIGCFRLVGTWLPGWADELERMRRERH